MLDHVPDLVDLEFIVLRDWSARGRCRQRSVRLADDLRALVFDRGFVSNGISRWVNQRPEIMAHDGTRRRVTTNDAEAGARES